MGKYGNLEEQAARKRKKSDIALEQEAKAGKESTKRLNANVPASLYRAVRMEAARQGVDMKDVDMKDVDMKDVLVEALVEYLPSYSDE